MGFDPAKANAYLQQARQIEQTLSEHQELFDEGKFLDFQSVTTTLETEIQRAQQEARKLSIGIVGAMKAGKSSFLNACIFGGKDVLPKAATPMTAALTRIRYSETPQATVHFYERKDWEKIEDNAQKYEEQLNTKYSNYCKIYDRSHADSTEGVCSKQVFERTLFQQDVSEVLKSAKELTQMVGSNSAILEHLGDADVLDGDIMAKLQDYVGARGRFTPIVNYVELEVNLPELEDLEIVDTPGLNDPIVSRSYATRQFLRACDVVILLSPCSQFMDANTVGLMANGLPDNGVRKVIVVGSKLDSGLLNEPKGSFAVASQHALNSYKGQFRNTMQQAMRNNPRRAGIMEKISESDLLFVSSTCSSMARKQKQHQPLSPAENLVLQNLHSNFPDFDETLLSSIGGINKVLKTLEAVRQQKAEIIHGRNNTLLETAQINHLRALDKIQQELSSSRTTLKNSTSEQLLQRTEAIQQVMESSRGKLMYIFDGAAIGCKNKVNQLLPQLTLEQQNHQRLDVQTSSEEHHGVEGTGLFGLIKEHYSYTVTNNRVDVSEVVTNLEHHASTCQNTINQEFQYVFNREQLSHRIVEVVLDAFRKSDMEFDEDDIRLPLQNVLNELSSPEIRFDYTTYIDKVESQFPSGYAENDDIHKLKSLQTRLLNEIDQDMGQQLTAALQMAANMLNKQAVTFADRIQELLCGELEKLQGQIQERETYLAAYQQFDKTIQQMKKQLAQTDSSH
ncbi:dynamin family protein [Faecalibacterium sp. 7]|uniref:dynamin family protein n=1 Tax=Faecalibacterium sp. 7 TaxID=3402017 RepID=UPI003C2FE347